MQKTNLKKLIKQVDRYTVSVITPAGRTDINAADFFRECIINFSEKENILNISYYKNK